MSSRISAVLMLFVLMLIPGDSHAQHQRNWSPNRYQMHCKHSQCLSDRTHRTLEGFLSEIATSYQKDGWRMVQNFGPVIGTGANAHVRVFDVAETTIAAAVGACGARTTSTMKFGQLTKQWLAQPYRLYFFAAHELFHLIQRRLPPFAQCNEKHAGWISESTANALAADLVRKKYPGSFPVQNETDARNFVGVRRYDVPLPQVHHNMDGSEKGSGVHMYYRANSFWRHLAETYHGGSYRYLARYFRVVPDTWDWIDWLHRRLLTDPEIGFALGPVYATFVADFATWGEWGKPGQVYGQSRWLDQTFGGCRTVEISPQNPAVQVPMAVYRTAAKCIDVKVRGISPLHRVTVKAAAFTGGTSTKLVDQVHLSLARSTDRVGFRCSDEIRKPDRRTRLMGLHRCLFVPSTGEVKIGGVSRPARAWDVIPQTITDGDGFDNLYMVSRVSPNPTSDGEPGDGGELLKFSMVFTLDTAEMTVDGQNLASAPDTRVVAHLNIGGTSNAQEQLPKHNAQGGIAMPLVYPHAPRNVQLPVIPLELASAQGKQGIWMIGLSKTRVHDDGLYQDRLESSALDSLSVIPANDDGPQPLRVGDTGLVPVMITGAIGGRPVASRAPGQLIVEEFTDDVLRARVQGTVCDMNASDDKDACPNPKRISATVVKGFAALHQPDARYQVEDSPSIRQYRQRMSMLMNKAMTATTQDGGGGPSDGAGGGSSTGAVVDPRTVPDPIAGPHDTTVVVKGTCNCTCNDLHSLKHLQKQLETGQKVESAAIWKRVRMQMSCMQPCSPVYFQCKKTGKPTP